MKEKSKEKNCISFCLPLRLYEEEFEKNLLFFVQCTTRYSFWSLFISDYNLARKPSGNINSYLVFMLFSVLSAERICMSVLKCAFET